MKKIRYRINFIDQLKIDFKKDPGKMLVICGGCLLILIWTVSSILFTETPLISTLPIQSDTVERINYSQSTYALGDVSTMLLGFLVIAIRFIWDNIWFILTVLLGSYILYRIIFYFHDIHHRLFRIEKALYQLIYQKGEIPIGDESFERPSFLRELVDIILLPLVMGTLVGLGVGIYLIIKGEVALGIIIIIIPLILTGIIGYISEWFEQKEYKNVD